MSKTFLLDWQYFFLLPIRTLNPQPPFSPPPTFVLLKGDTFYILPKRKIYMYFRKKNIEKLNEGNKKKDHRDNRR